MPARRRRVQQEVGAAGKKVARAQQRCRAPREVGAADEEVAPAA
jgi:hypothetical protein